jgi:hypothetical protein
MPGPAIGYLDEALRWWDHWLKGEPNGIMEEPMLRVWMQDQSATPGVASVPGYWAAEDAWPTRRIGERILYLGADRQLGDSAGAAGELHLDPVQTIGSASGAWCPSGAGAAQDLATELPSDQRMDDGRSLTFDSAPLDRTFEMLGSATLILEVASDRPVAFLAVRLNEVSVGGESARVTYGILNLCHRDSDAEPTPLVPGQRYTVRIPLDHAARRFHAGNRLRVSMSTAYWPLILPAPEPVGLTVFTGSSRLLLPTRPARDADSSLKPFGAAFVPEVALESVTSNPGLHRVDWDAVAKRQVIRHEVGDGTTLVKAVNTELIGKATVRSEIGEADTTGTISTQYLIGWQRDAWRPRVTGSSKITTLKTDFLLWGELVAYDGDEKIFTRTWERKIPRRFV